MTENAVYAIGAAVVMTISTITPAIAQGLTSKAAMDAISRQPDAAGNIRSTLIVSLGMIEALTIYGLLIAFMLVSKI